MSWRVDLLVPSTDSPSLVSGRHLRYSAELGNSHRYPHHHRPSLAPQLCAENHISILPTVTERVQERTNLDTVEIRFTSSLETRMLKLPYVFLDLTTVIVHVFDL